LVRRSEEKRFEGLIRRKHYLKNMDLVGRRLLYVAEYKGKWLALLTWSTPALHVKARDAWIGWSEEQRRRHLKFVVNNSRYVILTKEQYPNLATRVMGLCLQRVSPDWEKQFGYRLLAAESFVDGQLFRGTCYRASNWTRLGETQGWGRAANDFYVAHNRPKQLWVRELVSGGREVLRAESLAADLAPMERELPLPKEEAVVFDGKGNQPGLLGTITDLLSKEVISPSGQDVQRTPVDLHQGDQSQP